jgi:hypothetical protein
MDAEEKESFAALAEESSRKNESLGQMFNEAARDPSRIFRHNAGCFAQPGFHCNCTFARMNFNEMASLGATAQSGLVDLGTKPTLLFRTSFRAAVEELRA